jgi:protein O-GlcNAc transferase
MTREDRARLKSNASLPGSHVSSVASSARSRAADLRAAQTHQTAGRLAEADALYRRLYEAQPRDAAVLHAWARLRHGAGETETAGRLLQACVEAGGPPEAMTELAALLLQSRGFAAARRLLETACQRAPRLATAYFYLAVIAQAEGDPRQALDRLQVALRCDPANARIRLQLGQTLIAYGEAAAAVPVLAALVGHEPPHLDGLQALALAYARLNRFADALACHDRREKAGADSLDGVSRIALAFAHICDWASLQPLRARLAARVRSGRAGVLEPFALLATEDDPELHRNAAETMAAAVRAHVATLPSPRTITRHADSRIRIGYLSCDFRDHATCVLMTEMFERHDRARFDITAYSYSLDDGTPLRRRVVAAFEHFVEIGLEPPAATAQRIADDGIDILVDLKGYTDGSRPEIPALRPAPIQVSHIGYPGTLGADWIDYVIADPIVLSMTEQPHWAECIVHLPHSYQPNDRLRPAPAPDTDRAAHGLPADAFVFACFNNSYKITADRFAIWLHLLRETPGSVLWVFESNPQFAANLRAEAHRAGVSPQRLVFAPSASYDRHIARHGCADLFLDTGPYNAHTTASDALWAGLPVLTLAGRSFAARVAASLLHAVDLPELVTKTAADYSAMALRLAREPALLREFRARLQDSRHTAPLFDTPAFTRALETAYATMMDIRREGRGPRPFAVAPEALPSVR